VRIEPPPPRVSTARLADPGRGPAIVALLALAFVAAATGSSLLTRPSDRPTGSDGSADQADPGASLAALAAPQTTRSAAELPSPTREPSLRPGEIACLPAGWRLAYAGSMASWPVETWLAVEPAAASGPLDASIPVARLGHDVISGLGACAPPDGSDPGGRPAVIERAWRVVRAGGSDVARPIGLVALEGAAPTVPGPRPDALALVRPADTAGGWAAGEYVLELAYPEGVGQAASAGPSAWLRIQLDAPTP
jgi:hypothetical protein